MKNSKEYSKEIKKLYRSLNRKYPKIQKIMYDEPVDAIVYAIVSSKFNEKAAESAIKRFNDYFIDLNDLRVSRVEEIVEMLGQDTTVSRGIASKITSVLRSIFNEYHKVSLEALKKMGKRPARQILEKIEGLNRFIVDYCMLTSLQGHAIPLTEGMIEYLRSNQLVHPDADEQQIEGFLAKQISAKEGYEFYALLRRESEVGSSKKKRKTKKVTKKKTKTKTRKKTKKKLAKTKKSKRKK
jgi:endonuclease III